MLKSNNEVFKFQNHNPNSSIQVLQVSIDPQLLKFVEEGGTIGFVLALAFLVGMLTRFVEKIKK
jgi:O-antigen ligase